MLPSRSPGLSWAAAPPNALNATATAAATAHSADQRIAAQVSCSGECRSTLGVERIEVERVGLLQTVADATATLTELEARRSRAAARVAELEAEARAAVAAVRLTAAAIAECERRDGRTAERQRLKTALTDAQAKADDVVATTVPRRRSPAATPARSSREPNPSPLCRFEHTETGLTRESTIGNDIPFVTNGEGSNR
jgi:hypothetical protein